jgi:hypothetical protein
MTLARYQGAEYVGTMTAVAEIESAIERLTAEELKELAAWLEEYQGMVGASAEAFALYDRQAESRSLDPATDGGSLRS